MYTKGYAHVTIQVVYVSQISLPKLPEALLKSSFLGSFDLIASILEHPEEGQKWGGDFDFTRKVSNIPTCCKLELNLIPK